LKKEKQTFLLHCGNGHRLIMIIHPDSSLASLCLSCNQPFKEVMEIGEGSPIPPIT
jgi:hypothetical protein